MSKMEKRVILMDEEILYKHRQEIKEDIKELITKGMAGQPEEVMNAREVCQMLKKSRQTIENWSKTGLLKKRSLGDSVFYLRSEVLNSLKNKTQKP